MCVHQVVYMHIYGYLYIYNKNTSEQLDRRLIGAPSFVAPVRMGSGIVTADFAGNVIQFKPF